MQRRQGEGDGTSLSCMHARGLLWVEARAGGGKGRVHARGGTGREHNMQLAHMEIGSSGAGNTRGG